MAALNFRKKYPNRLPSSLYGMYDAYLKAPESFKTKNPVIYKILLQYIEDEDESKSTEGKIPKTKI